MAPYKLSFYYYLVVLLKAPESTALHQRKSPTGLILFHSNPYYVNVTILALTADILLVML